jgi:hypothetical protein
MKRTTTRREIAAKGKLEKNRILTLDVSIASGPITEDFARKNPVVSRTIEIRGGHTLEDLHQAIFDAFDRDDEHMSEFQIGGRRPMDPKARRYVPPMAIDDEVASDVTDTAIGSLGLKVGDEFAYWFDFGDDWWHRIAVLGVDEAPRGGKLPRVVRRVGASPPQYVDWDEEA